MESTDTQAQSNGDDTQTLYRKPANGLIITHSAKCCEGNRMEGVTGVGSLS